MSKKKRCIVCCLSSENGKTIPMTILETDGDKANFE